MSRQGHLLQRPHYRQPDISGSRICPGSMHGPDVKRISANKRWCVLCAETEWKKLLEQIRGDVLARQAAKQPPPVDDPGIVAPDKAQAPAPATLDGGLTAPTPAPTEVSAEVLNNDFLSLNNAGTVAA